MSKRRRFIVVFFSFVHLDVGTHYNRNYYQSNGFTVTRQQFGNQKINKKQRNVKKVNSKTKMRELCRIIMSEEKKNVKIRMEERT